jgi:hypothetical protein
MGATDLEQHVLVLTFSELNTLESTVVQPSGQFAGLKVPELPAMNMPEG